MHARMLWAAAFLLAWSAPASAQVVAASNPASVVRALHNAGFQAKLEKDKTGDPMIKSASSGSSYVIYFYNCTKNSACETVQFHASYQLDKGKAPTVEKINEWNRQQRFGRAFVNTDGQPTVEMDVDLADGGMSEALFGDNVEFWVAIMAAFEKHIGW